MVRSVSYLVLGNQSVKVKRNGQIFQDILEDTNGKINAYQKWLSLNKEADKSTTRDNLKL
jgi:hypothetical protein